MDEGRFSISMGMTHQRIGAWQRLYSARPWRRIRGGDPSPPRRSRPMTLPRALSCLIA
jgi:hypothetical protein